MKFQTQLEKGRIIVVHHIFSKDEMKQMTGTTWVGSGNAPVKITNVGVISDNDGNTVWVDINYEWEPTTSNDRGFNNKDFFAFQCRYSLVVDENAPEFVRTNLCGAEELQLK